MSNIEHTQKNKDLTITITESFTIEDSKWFTEKFVKLLKKNNSCSIVMKNMDKLDLSAIQMIQATLQYCKAENKKIELFFNLNDEIKDLVEKAGIQHILPIRL